MDEKEKFYKIVNNDIKNEEIRDFVNYMLEKTPEYFWTIPASSSGKYHPTYALGKSGLVKHTIACVIIAKELFELYNFDDIEKDIIISSLLLHDTYKQGINETGNTKFEHPMIIKMKIRDIMCKYPKLFDILLEISDCVGSHMGKWRTENPHWGNKTGFILPIPKTETQKFVHMCDYLASRKSIEIIME